jgi:signal transduction histidine kinase
MAKKFVRITLATKLRLMFGAAVLGIIAAAIAVPWYFMELLAEQGLQLSAAELTRLRLNEWEKYHRAEDPNQRRLARVSEVEKAYEHDGKGRKGPTFNILSTDPKLDSSAQQAMDVLFRNKRQDLFILKAEDERGRTVYRCFRAVRIGSACADCHNASNPSQRLRFDRDQLVGMIDAALPGAVATGTLIWWTRGAFVIGGLLAAMVAVIVFAVLTQRLILRPVRRLRDIADKVAEGDLAVRSDIRTNDELQRLGDSFNEMLSAIAEQHEKLRSANRALDLKLNELAEVNVTLYQANRVKSEFLANISHELRTPLNSIIGFGDLLSESSDERIRRYGQNVGIAARDLLNMINDLLDLAKIEAGKAVVRFDKVSVTDACQTLLALMKPLADKKQIDLRGELGDDVPLIVTDAGKVQQILFNLLSNAIKVTPVAGKVTLQARKEPSRPGSVDEVSISVADTGPGIAEDQQHRIFEKFYQVDRSLTKETSGTGLGLSISKELTNLLGGRLALKSSPGHGAEFTLTLPIEPAVKPEVRPPAGKTQDAAGK